MSLPLLSFSTRTLDHDDGFGAYHDLYAGGSDVARVDAAFHAEVRAYRFNRMLVFDRRLNGTLHSRSPARIRRDGFDHVTLHMLVSGELLAGPLGDERRVRPGEILVLDTTLPQRSESRHAHVITVALARDQIGPITPDIRTFHGAILPDCAAGLVADLMLSLARRASTLAPEATERSGLALGMLLAAALKSQLPPTEAVLWPEQSDLSRRQEAETYIEAHLTDRGLNADAVATGIAVSRSILYRCFAVDGGVARFIQQRRLERIRDALRRRSEIRSIAALAYEYGFATEQHFNRAFRSSFGRPPGQFRTAIEQLRRRAGPKQAGVLRLVDWHCELY